MLFIVAVKSRFETREHVIILRISAKKVAYGI